MVLQRTAKHEVGLEAIQDRNVSQKRGGRQIHKTNVQKNDFNEKAIGNEFQQKIINWLIS